MKRFSSRKLWAFLVALVIVVAIATPMGRAAESCTVTFSDPTVTVGSNVTIQVNVSGNVAAATIRMAYDQSYLEFVPGSSNLGYGSGGGGAVLLDNENMSSGNMSFSMTFRTLKTGSTTITCTSYDIVDGNGDMMSVNMGSSAVTINAAPTASSNADLASLSISPGSLSPKFSPSTTNYQASVSNATTSVAVSAKTADGAAKVAVWGNTKLSVGNNTVTVQVTAENGTKKVYTITVNRAGGSGGNTDGEDEQPPEQTPSPQPTPDTSVYVTLPDGAQLAVSTTLPKGELPQGFVESQVEFQGQTFPGITLANGTMPAIYLQGDEAHPAGYYFLNVDTGHVSPLTQVAMAQGMLIVVDIPQSLVDAASKSEQGDTSVGNGDSQAQTEQPSQGQTQSEPPQSSDDPRQSSTPEPSEPLQGQTQQQSASQLEVEMPKGYVVTQVQMGRDMHTVLAPQGVEEPNHYVVCALDAGGNLGWYLFDPQQVTLQRYQFAQTAQVEPQVETEEPEQTPQPTENGFVFSLLQWRVETSWSDATVSRILAGLVVLSLVLVVVVVVLVILLVRTRAGWRRTIQHYQEEERYQRAAMGHRSSRMTVDDILAEYKNSHKE